MSSINFNHSKNLQEAFSVPADISSPEDVAREDPSIKSAQEIDDKEKCRDAYTFLRLLHSYEKLQGSRQGGVIQSLIQAEKESAYNSLVEIAEKYPEWQSKIPPRDPHNPVLH